MRIGEFVVEPMQCMDNTISQEDIKIAMLAVPAKHAQAVADQLVAAGVQAILNYAPTSPQVPDGIRIRNIDPVIALQSMTYYLGEPGNR